MNISAQSAMAREIFLQMMIVFVVFASDHNINPNLGVSRGVILPPLPRWFSLNNSEMVKAVNLAFCSIQ